MESQSESGDDPNEDSTALTDRRVITPTDGVESGLAEVDTDPIDNDQSTERHNGDSAIDADNVIVNRNINTMPESQNNRTDSGEKCLEFVNSETRDNHMLNDKESKRSGSVVELDGHSIKHNDDAVTVPRDSNITLTDPGDNMSELNEQTGDKVSISEPGLAEKAQIVLRDENEQNTENRCDTSTPMIGYPDENDWKSRMQHIQMSMEEHLSESESWRKKIREKKTEMVRRCAQLEYHRIRRLMTEGIVINIAARTSDIQQDGTTAEEIKNDSDDFKYKKDVNGGCVPDKSRQDNVVLDERADVVPRHEVGVMAGEEGVTNEMLLARNKTTKY